MLFPLSGMTLVSPLPAPVHTGLIPGLLVIREGSAQTLTPSFFKASQTELSAPPVFSYHLTSHALHVIMVSSLCVLLPHQSWGDSLKAGIGYYFPFNLKIWQIDDQ